MKTLSLNTGRTTRDWQRAVAVGFLALTCFGAAVDRRNTVVDRSVVGARPVEAKISPPTNRALVQEMLTHD